MSTGRHSFRLSDLKRVLLAARETGVPVAVQITRDRITVTTKQDAASGKTDEANPWDEVLDEKNQKRTS